MTTLAEKHPEVCAKLTENGYFGIVEMAGHFPDARSMSLELGYDPAAARNWMVGANLPSRASEANARSWLKANAARAPITQAPHPNAQAEMVGIMEHVTPVAEAAPPAPPTGALLMVICPPDKVGKITRMLEMVGCEVVQV